MPNPDLNRPPRLRLERVGLVRAQALAAGDYSGVDAAPGWPHAGTLDGLRLDAQHASRDEDTGFFAVLTATGQVVGDAGWKGGPDAYGSAEIGYGLAAPQRGIGLGTELVGLIADWAQAQPGVVRVIAQVHESNEPSQRALLRSGFTLAGREPLHLIFERPARREVTDE